MSGQSQFPWREKLFTNFAARAAVYKPNQAYDQLCYNSPSHEFHRAIVGLVRNHKPPSLPRPLNIAGNLQFNYTMPVTIVAHSTDCLAKTNTPVFWVKSVDVSACWWWACVAVCVSCLSAPVTGRQRAAPVECAGHSQD